jgi:hypothetical protein
MAKPTSKDLYYFNTLLSAFRLKKHGMPWLKTTTISMLGNESKMSEFITNDVAEYGSKRQKDFFVSDMNKKRVANILGYFNSKVVLLNDIADVCANDLKTYLSSNPDESAFVGQLLDIIAMVNSVKRAANAQRKAEEKAKREDMMYDLLSKYNVSEEDMSTLMGIIGQAISAAAPEFAAEE